MSKQREAFEAWFADSKLGPRRSEADWSYHAAWEAWQASRAAALEEAAALCELARGQSLQAVEQLGAEESHEACAAIGGAQQASKLRDALIALKEQS